MKNSRPKSKNWSISNNSDNYDEKYIKLKLSSDDNLPLKKLEIHNMVITVRAVFDENKKYYPHKL